MSCGPAAPSRPHSGLPARPRPPSHAAPQSSECGADWAAASAAACAQAGRAASAARAAPTADGRLRKSFQGTGNSGRA
eukprot:518125-Prymnesium_polylepis.1